MSIITTCSRVKTTTKANRHKVVEKMLLRSHPRGRWLITSQPRAQLSVEAITSIFAKFRDVRFANMAVCASRGFKKEPGASLSLVLLMHGLLVHSAPFGQSECPGHLSIPKYEEIRSQCRALYAERPRCNLTRFAVVAVFRFDRACNKSVDFYIAHPFCNLGFVTWLIKEINYL